MLEGNCPACDCKHKDRRGEGTDRIRRQEKERQDLREDGGEEERTASFVGNEARAT